MSLSPINPYLRTDLFNEAEQARAVATWLTHRGQYAEAVRLHTCADLLIELGLDAGPGADAAWASCHDCGQRVLEEHMVDLYTRHGIVMVCEDCEEEREQRNAA